MINQKMLELGTKKSTIREIFEFGKKRALEVGEENIFDFSLGNPNVPAPDCVKEIIIDLLENFPSTKLHGYTVAPGDVAVRQSIAKSIVRRFDLNVTEKNIFMTAGAAASLTICFKALAEAGDEFITFAPFFPEYRCFVESVGGILNVVPAKTDDFQIDFPAFEKMISKKTKAIILNSPNNPSGAVYSRETIQKLADLLHQKEIEFAHPIFLIADEPYREIVYDNLEVPYVPKFYKNTLVCYSFSKSFSLPGERIGYILVPNEIVNFEKIYGAVAGAARVLTHVNAPSLFQQVVARCVENFDVIQKNVQAYEKNGKTLHEGLIAAGFECLQPQGAFYLFPKALEEDDQKFCERAKKYDLLLVPGKDFGCPGYFRAAYCVSYKTIVGSLPLFKKLAEEYQK